MESTVVEPRGKLAFHDAANLFPLDDENIESMADDIKANGLQCPIELCDGKIIDGRRRFMACRHAGVEPEYCTVSPADPVAYVLSLNLHRRHLTPSQRSMVAARAREMYDKAAKERQSENASRHNSKVENLPPLDKSKARDAAGKAVGVSGKSVDFAGKVLKQGTPELVKAVDEGRMAVSTAAVYASEPEDVQREILSDPKRNRTYVSLAKGQSQQGEEDAEPEEGVSRGVGVRYANEAIDCLKKIPSKDALRKRAFQIVTDWMRKNK